jgi:hypothetical protein
MSGFRVLTALLTSLEVLVPVPARAGSAAPDPAAPAPPGLEDILIVGDSVTAGVFALCLDDSLAEWSWANRLFARYGLPIEYPRLSTPVPIDHVGLIRDGWGLDAWRYLASATPPLFEREARWREGEARRIVAVPGQTVRQVLEQSSDDPGSGTVGWILGEWLLPEGLTAAETAVSSAGDPSWVVLWIGNNDLLADLGIVGPARSLDPAAFAWHYDVLAVRLRAAMRPDTPPARMLVCTLPDVTRLPVWQPVPPGVRDERGRPLPAGTVASAFLVPYRDDRYRRGVEAFDPERLAELRDRNRAYNQAIREIAARHGFTVVDLEALLLELQHAPDWMDVDSPWFSPDLHHPSARTQLAIAHRVDDRLREVAGVGPDPRPWPEPESVHGLPAPVNRFLDPKQRARAVALMRAATVGDGEPVHYPPRPSLRASLELGGQTGRDRTGDASLGVLAALEAPPHPVTTRWNSRGFVAVRAVAAWTREGEADLPEEGGELRIGAGMEPIGAWHWQRFEAGYRYQRRAGSGWWARGEWRFLYVEAAAIRWTPRRFEAGIRFGLDSRRGHHGN